MLTGQAGPVLAAFRPSRVKCSVAEEQPAVVVWLGNVDVPSASWSRSTSIPGRFHDSSVVRPIKDAGVPSTAMMYVAILANLWTATDCMRSRAE